MFPWCSSSSLKIGLLPKRNVHLQSINLQGLCFTSSFRPQKRKKSSSNLETINFQGLCFTMFLGEGSNFANRLESDFAWNIPDPRPRPGDVCETTAAYSLFPGCQMWKFPKTWTFLGFPRVDPGLEKWVGESPHVCFPNGLFVCHSKLAHPMSSKLQTLKRTQFLLLN